LLGQTCHYPTYSAAVAAPTRARSLHDALPIYEEPVVIYHSHTATEAYPSRTDVDLAAEPGAHYLLVSTRKPDTVEIRSFRIVDGQVAEEPVYLTGVDGQPVRVIEATVDGTEVQTYKFSHTLTRLDYDCRA